MQIKVLSLNVWNGGKLFDNIEAFLKEQMPDIAFFQEVFNAHRPDLPKSFNTLDEFQKIFPGYFSHFVPAFGDIGSYGTFDRGSAIFSRFPIVASGERFFDLPYRVFNEQKERNFEFTPRVLQHCTLDVGGKKIQAFNNHGIWGHDGHDNPRRLAMSDVIIEEIKDQENVILAGDFNLNPYTQAVKNIEKHLASVFGETLVNTFNMKHKTDPGYAAAAVDMMFVSPSVTILSKECPQVDVSDHLPLVVKLEI